MISGDAMKIITCYKCVPDEQDIAINNADGTLDFSKADSKISQYDLNAIGSCLPVKTAVGRRSGCRHERWRQSAD